MRIGSGWSQLRILSSGGFGVSYVEPLGPATRVLVKISHRHVLYGINANDEL